ncbi:hypothetical protein FRC12_020632 [Ceratobasidium sp. 428]|nr:hypothetical protein FRC12_020632 [Ceratobasidium sp. 428]
MSHNQMLTDSDSDGAILPATEGSISVSESSTPPTSGPEFFEWRRNQWRNARPKNESTRASPSSESTSHARLETVVTSPGYEYNDTIWDTYLKNVNERLKGGVMLRKPLPLWVVIRILRAGWMRDGTWFGPSGAGVSEPAPPMALETSSAMTETPAITPTAFLSELSTSVNATPVSAAGSGRVYASRRIRAPGWNSAALEVERVLQAVDGRAK